MVKLKKLGIRQAGGPTWDYFCGLGFRGVSWCAWWESGKVGKWAWGEGKGWYGQRWAKRSVGQQRLALEGLKPEKGLAGDREKGLT